MERSQFVDRDDEPDLLRSRFEGEGADLVVIYGRRRPGKSALVREAIADRDDVSLFMPEDLVGGLAH